MRFSVSSSKVVGRLPPVSGFSWASFEVVPIWDGSGSGYEVEDCTHLNAQQRKFGGLALFFQGSKCHISFILIKIREVSEIEEKEDNHLFVRTYPNILSYAKIL